MPWNKSRMNDIKNTSKAEYGLMKRCFFISIIVVIVTIAIMYVSSSKTEPDEIKATDKRQRKSLIQEVSPHISKKTIKPTEEASRKIPYWKQANTNGLTRRQLMKWKIHNRPPAIITNDTSQLEKKPDYAIFPTYVENDLASLLTLGAGDCIVGDPGYERWFTKAFLKSLETPIIVTKEDSPEQAQLKRDMIALKLELKDHYDAGEDIAEIMRKTHEELQDLSRFKNEIESSLREMIHKGENFTEQDVDDLISAANIMLDKRGIAPIKLGPVAKRRLMRQSNKIKEL